MSRHETHAEAAIMDSIQSEQQSSPRRPDWLALGAIAVTIGVHLALKISTGRPNVLFICGSSLFWAAYVAVRTLQDRTVLREWGFRIDNLRPATAASAVIFAALALGLAGYGALAGTLHGSPHLALELLLYPVWGVIQQFLTLALVVANLQRIPALRKRSGVLVFLGAGLFGAVHLYDLRLAGGTFAMELVMIPLYLAYRNLWPLGVLHGWAGTLFYLWVLNEDLWAAMSIPTL
jgi:uncharacterized protein